MPPSDAPPSNFNDRFITALDASAPTNANDDPNYYARYPRSLITSSNLDTFMTGAGSAIYDSLVPLLESTSHELILVTCFWARSDTLDTLNKVLRSLSDKAVRRGTDKIRVRLCFSSSSIFQKLFHNQTMNGKTYPPSVWVKKLGLPDPAELNGLEISIKSIFILPFSVMHPKFIIIDRKTAILPSCNISWEEWFEGAITLSGPVVDQFLKFYRTFWERRQDAASTINAGDDLPPKTQSDALKSSVQLAAPKVYTIFLPSPHRRNPRFSFFGSPDTVQAPPTPLNTFILILFARAERSIRIQTPNVTAPPVLSALLAALTRGIDVRILTSERLMILEQLVTAGTTTSRCIKKLIKRYQQLPTPPQYTDEEAALAAPKRGSLHISYFEPIGGPKKRGNEAGEPQQSHLKMTIVDNEVLVLGSGNLDRASWFTSQELGVAFFDEAVVKKVESAVDEGMQGRSKIVFASDG
jgi:phosphatidylserine/phosphatidylglycerophosphate/cardiolipin synthase-like enzyme